MTEIFILCNSPECLELISSGSFPDLHKANLFTCNDAFTFFRTSGRHFNFCTDMPHIQSRIEWLYKIQETRGIDFIYSKWEFINAKIATIPEMNFSPVCVGASSAINALFYLNSLTNKNFDTIWYDTIWLLGYTINEWEEMNSHAHLLEKKLAFDAVYENYKVERPRPYVFKYTRK